MNYYEHHIGDYDSATAHLSVLEDGVYSRLIRVYYRTELPLPADVKQVCRLVRAVSKAERETVSAILSEFFDCTPDGWHNSRCDEEIARFREKQEKARRSADARWSAYRPQSERNANASNESDANAMRTHDERNALQSPDTNHQTPDKQPRKRGRAAAQLVSVEDLVAEGVSEQHASDWLVVRGKKNLPLTRTAWEGVKAEAATVGMDAAAAVKTATENGWAGFKAKWLRDGAQAQSGAAWAGAK